MAVQAAMESVASCAVGVSAAVAVAAYPGEAPAVAVVERSGTAGPMTDLPLIAAPLIRLGNVIGTFSWD